MSERDEGAGGGWKMYLAGRIMKDGEREREREIERERERERESAG